MVRRFTWVAGAFACSLFIAGNAAAQQSFTFDAGFVVGDPASGKLLPFYEFSSGRCDLNENGTIDPIENIVPNDCGSDSDCSGGETCVPAGNNTATIVGLQNTALNTEGRDDILVHIEVFDKESTPTFSKTICLTQGDFGYVILQQTTPSEAQLADIALRCGPDSPHPSSDANCKATVISQEIEGIPSQGYVTFAARRANDNPDVLTRVDRACEFGADTTDTDAPDQASLGGPQLMAWGVFQDIGEGFFGTELPVLSAGVNFRKGAPSGAGPTGIAEPCGILENGNKATDLVVSGSLSIVGDAGAGTACLTDTSRNATNDAAGSGHFGGLISGDRRVGARYDCNPANDSTSTLVVWAQNNYDALAVPIIARGEDEGCKDGNLDLPIEVNVINLCDLPPVKSLANSATQPQFRGAVEFLTPGTAGIDGFAMFTLITQAGQNFVLLQKPYVTSQGGVDDAVSIVCPSDF